MNSRIRRHLTYANVTATLALVFAMSGGALAAKHYLITSTGQINPKVLKKLRARVGPPGPTGKAGPPGPIGPIGHTGAAGASSAFNSNSQFDAMSFPSVSEQIVTVASLSLPAGNFSVSGKLIADNDSSAPPRPLVRCELLLGGASLDSGWSGITLGIGGSDPEGDRHYIVLSGIGWLGSPGTAEIICKVNGTVGKYMDRSITAIQVGSIH